MRFILLYYSLGILTAGYLVCCTNNTTTTNNATSVTPQIGLNSTVPTNSSTTGNLTSRHPVIDGIVKAFSFFSSGIDRTDLAANLLSSYYYTQYFRNKLKQSYTSLSSAVLDAFKVIVVGPYRGENRTAALQPTPPSSLEKLVSMVNDRILTGYEEVEYKFFKKDSVADRGYSVRVRFELNQTGTKSYTRQPVDELGYLWSEDGGVSMVCLEGRWYDSKADSILRTKATGSSIPGDCSTFQPTPLKSLSYQNLFLSKDAGHNLRVVNYHTTQFGFSFLNCEVVLESAGCVMRTVKLPEWINLNFHNDTHQYPLLHILINENLDNTGCKLRMCAVSNRAGKSLGEMRFKGVEVLVDRPISGTGRKLLDVREPVTRGYKNRNICNTKNQLLPYQKSLMHNLHRSVPGTKVSYCNGSVHTTLPLGSLHGCYSVGTVTTHHQCPGLKRGLSGKMSTIENVNCSIDYHIKECSNGHYCFQVTMLGSGAVTVKSNHHHEVVNCKHECLLSLPDTQEDTIVTCPDGKSHRLLYNLLIHDCPFERYLGHNAFFICRMSHHPRLVYCLFFWIFGGCPLLYVTFTLIKFSILALAWTVIKVRRTLTREKGTCDQCGDFVPTGPEWQRHDQCKQGSCPYCRSRFSISGLKQHIQVCLERDRVRNSDEEVMNRKLVCYPISIAGRLASKAQKHTVKVGWFIILLILLLLSTRPANGLQNVELQKGIWEQEVEEVEVCKVDCTVESSLCYCEMEQLQDFHSGRRLLFNHPAMSGIYSKNPNVTRRTVEVINNVKAPWGIVNVKSTHQPTYSSSALQMSWSSSDELEDGSIVLSGRSSSILKLEPNTGVTWNIKAKQSKEERKVSISVIDHSQIYNARFQYLTGDRTVGSWMHGTCTEVCPEKCGCTMSSCHHLEWLKSRNWHCNPLWCWAMDQGCTCCAIDIQNVYNNWVVSKWTLEYIGTEALVCVDYDNSERECDIVNTATQFESGPYQFQVSDVSNVQHRLPSEILIFHKIPKDADTLDLMKHYHITSAENACKLQSCTHGSVGDSQIYDLDRLIGNDIDAEHFFKNVSGKERGHWMSWEGVTMDYHCNQGHWPDCVYTGVVEQNSEAFANLLSVEQDYTKTFFFHNVNCRINGSVPALDLQARSKVSPGSLSVFLEVKGLTLMSDKAHLTSLSFRTLSCTGCYGCVEGGTCSVIVAMSGVPKIGLHFVSMTEHVTVEQSTELIEENEPTTTNIRFFSAAPVKELCIKLKEFTLCKTCDKAKQVSCVKVSLKDPERVLLEHRGTLVSTTTDNCTSIVSCWAQSFTGFGLGIGNLLSYLGGSLLKGIILFVLPLATVVLLILYGPSVVRLLVKFRRLRGLARKARARRFDNDGIMEIRQALLKKEDKDEHDLMNYFVKNK
ncbi:glycoprotein precursor [Tunis virus]|uniref:M polyprotein n=1 Tax=Tunis virus TaxID=1810944 RepID=A0A191KWE3_9VIRU|nr:glycoprotein precursor [Tunis virus]AMT75435.1 glycoprotein precursor [Tunis virus]